MLSLLLPLSLAHERLPLGDANNIGRKADAYNAVLIITGFLAASYSLTPTNTQA
jgi:hypothetical protein